MPLYEFVLRAPGRPDEVRLSDYSGLVEGDEITIANRGWVVAAKEPATTERPDRLRVEERIVLVPSAAASDRAPGRLRRSWAPPAQQRNRD